ncbi:hypothetical protein MKZ38_006687 [Zalerion maritima]|uniref:Protochlorophyllide reductase n=1 Tax=Zalerion maritima TaxID=339359 RepID=A0AAD5RIN5_9PEZI|nr:hypothetical protein MKZ38_006687 [Zalerion maritima]
MGQLWSMFRQMLPPAPTYTEKDYPDLTGKVFLVTGANTGVGYEVARLLHSKNAHVFIASRNESKALSAIDKINSSSSSSCSSSKGTLTFLKLDLSDLSSIKQTALDFDRLSNEQGLGGRLDVVICNAGVMMPEPGSMTKQSYEMQLGTNCLGHFLLVKLLTPYLLATVQGKTHDKPSEGTVRVVWVSSSAMDLSSPKGGIPLDEEGNVVGAKIGTPTGGGDGKSEEKEAKKGGILSIGPRSEAYGISKAGNYFEGTEMARRMMKEGVVSVALNPGNLHSELDRHVNSIYFFRLARTLMTYSPVHGAYTELFAALSPEISLSNSGCWVVPWGRIGDPRPDLVAASRTKEEGGTGQAEKFWKWCEKEVEAYV